jgi:hypothetical protein
MRYAKPIEEAVEIAALNCCEKRWQIRCTQERDTELTCAVIVCSDSMPREATDTVADAIDRLNQWFENGFV